MSLSWYQYFHFIQRKEFNIFFLHEQSWHKHDNNIQDQLMNDIKMITTVHDQAQNKTFYKWPIDFSTTCGFLVRNQKMTWTHKNFKKRKIKER